VKQKRKRTKTKNSRSEVVHTGPTIYDISNQQQRAMTDVNHLGDTQPVTHTLSAPVFPPGPLNWVEADPIPSTPARALQLQSLPHNPPAAGGSSNSATSAPQLSPTPAAAAAATQLETSLSFNIHAQALPHVHAYVDVPNICTSSRASTPASTPVSHAAPRALVQVQRSLHSPVSDMYAYDDDDVHMTELTPCGPEQFRRELRSRLEEEGLEGWDEIVLATGFDTVWYLHCSILQCDCAHKLKCVWICHHHSFGWRRRLKLHWLCWRYKQS